MEHPGVPPLPRTADVVGVAEHLGPLPLPGPLEDLDIFRAPVEDSVGLLSNLRANWDDIDPWVAQRMAELRDNDFIPNANHQYPANDDYVPQWRWQLGQ